MPPINVSIQKDWLKSGSSSNGQAPAQARKAQVQARSALKRPNVSVNRRAIC